MAVTNRNSDSDGTGIFNYESSSLQACEPSLLASTDSMKYNFLGIQIL